MNESLVERLLARWPLVAVGGGLLLIAVIFYGCDSRRPAVTVEKRDVQESCGSRLQNALDQARPASLGLVGVDASLRVRPADAAAAFTEWLRQPDCLDAVPAEALSDEGRALVARLLGAEAAKDIDATRFSAFDAAHVRDALLDFAAAGRLAKGATDDLDRAVRVFDYVARTVSTAGASSVEVPMTAYEAHLFGRGSAAERTLLFANLLRQLRLDAVVLRPADGGGEAGPWWVGVLLGDGVYLFDPELGLPVPAAGAASSAPAFLPKPATWAEAVADPDLLVAYRRDAGMTTEPIDAARLAKPRVELVGPASFWRTAMERLELSLPEDRGVLLYDPLHDTAAGEGLFRRVADAGRSTWGEDAIGVWAYPLELEATRVAISASQRERLEGLIRKYLGPVEEDPQEAGKVGPRKALWETRVAHMSGRTREAISRYQHIRLSGASDSTLTPSENALNLQAADEAFYWAGHAQFAEGDFESAADTARAYVDRDGDRGEEATALLALSLAATGHEADAAAEAGKLPGDSPLAARLKWFAARWSARAAPAER